MNEVDAYIENFPEKVQSILKQIREIIFRIAPEAEESIAYGMPAYKTHGKPLVYFAGYNHHIGFYATPTGHEAFKEALSIYKQGKGSVQFPLDQEIPFALIGEIVKFRVDANNKSTKPKPQ
ncbi:iron chaperone [Shivajiella indica]|uniref:Iron chaperone n=1 Tax=Shivajiella indica TaxID=872115 RepID=A0ABW5B6S1_9BACT